MKIIYGLKKESVNQLQDFNAIFEKFEDFNKKLRNFIQFDFRKNRRKTQNFRTFIVFLIDKALMCLQGRNFSKKKLR